MSLISWNCQGLGNPWTVRSLHDLVRENNPNILFLMETRMKAIEVEGIRTRLRFNSVFTVSSNGRKGGLVMFWRDTVDLEIMNFSRNHIDAIIKDSTIGKMWRLTGFYGSPERSGRSETWQLLKRLGDQNQVPWVVLGDFNEILCNSEKMGKAARAESQMKAFREVLDNHCLRDLGFKGPWYTWDNRRLGLENIKERLDRVVAGLDWSTLYPEASVKHLSASSSDHRPVQLFLNKQSVHHRRRRIFRFEQAWAREESCEETVKEAWQQHTTGSKMYEVTEAIKSCRRRLTKWDREVYRSSQQRLHQLGEDLRCMEERNHSDDTQVQMNKTRAEMNELLKREEIMWRQRSRVQWLQEGNRNTKYFHNKANQRRRKNAIMSIKDEHGVAQEEPLEIERIVVNYFSQIYSSTNPQNFGSIMEAVKRSVTSEMNVGLTQEFKAEEVVLALHQMYPTKSPGPDERGDELVDYIPGVSTCRIADLPTITDGAGRQVLPGVLEGVLSVSKAQYLIFTSFYELEAQTFDTLKAQFPFPVYPIGPAIPYLELEDTSSVTNAVNYFQWLDCQPPCSVLYISLGSFLSVSNSQMDEIIGGVRESGVQCLWVSRGETTWFKEGFGDIGLVVPWCDQLKVLCHSSIGGFWTHCGWNSTLEAIFAGVPMLTFPIFWDQVPNSKRIVEDLKIGWRVKKDVGSKSFVTRGEISELVKRFMDKESNEVNAMRQRSKELQKSCQQTIAKGGSSDTNLDAFIKNIRGGHCH